MRKAVFLTCLALVGTVDPASPTSLASAEASVAVAYTLEELVDAAPTAVVVRATEKQSQWEEVAGSRRIVTYTKLRVDDRVYGSADATVWVRTLGGAVGKIGQQVAGEAVFRVNERALVFLTATRAGTLVVAGRAQGHFPVREPAKKGQAPILRPSPSLGTVLDRPGPRVTVYDELVDEPLVDGIALVRATKAARDAQK